MHTIQISNDLKNILEQLVTRGFAGSETEVVEEAVRRCIAEYEYSDEELIAAVEAGLADMRGGNYTTIDGPDAREAFWDGIRREVKEEVAAMRAKVVRSKA